MITRQNKGGKAGKVLNRTGVEFRKGSKRKIETGKSEEDDRIKKGTGSKDHRMHGGG